MSTESKSLSTVPDWDGKQPTAAMYISKLKTMMEYHDSRDVIDKTIMSTCPAKSAYDGLVNSNDDGDKKLAKLYR